MNKMLLVGVAGIVSVGFLAGCSSAGTGENTGNLINRNNPHSTATSSANSQTPPPPSNTTTSKTTNGYLLQPMPYSRKQLTQIRSVAQTQGVTAPYVLTKSAGTTGIYKLVSITGHNHVLNLGYENLLIMESPTFVRIKRALTAGGMEATMKVVDKATLNGIAGQWWKVTYKDGNLLNILTLKLHNTWVGVIPPVSQAPHRGMNDAVAESLQPLASVSGN